MSQRRPRPVRPANAGTPLGNAARNIGRPQPMAKSTNAAAKAGAQVGQTVAANAASGSRGGAVKGTAAAQAVASGAGAKPKVVQGGQSGQAAQGGQGKTAQVGSKTNGAKGGGGGQKGGGGRGGRRRNGQPQMPSHTDLVPALDAMPVNKSIYNGSGGQQQSKRGPQGGQNAGGGQGGGQGGQNMGGGQERRANYTSRETKLRVIPLGGLGEVGKNMMAIEYGNDIITIDMGFMFPSMEKQPGVDYMIPDVSYLVKNKHKIRAHFLTHAHEDHMGGIPFILPQIPAPFYAAKFSIGMVEKKLQEYHLQTQPQLRVLDPDKHERVQVGVFTVEMVRVTHTIPDACAVVVTTPVGKIINTGDWRNDPTPVDGKVMDNNRMAELGKEGILLLMSDSTSCEFLGRQPSETEIMPSFDDLFTRAQGRIILASFSSQINRIQMVVNATARHGRKIAFVGRSMLANVELAVKLGYIKMPAGLVTRVQDIVNLKDDKVVIMCTGSQGEESSALTRMGTGDHQNVKIKAGDTVIMSSSIIPGNERSVVASMDALLREGAKVYHHVFRDLDNVGPLHVGGHAKRDEIIDLVQTIKPKYFMPIHGEFHMLVRNAEAATMAGVPQSNIFVMDNGDVLELGANSAQKAQRVPAGVVMIDGAGVGDVEGVVLRDRLAMANDGVFMIIATVSRKTGKLVTSPDIISRGFIYMKENEELINRARAEVRRMFDKRAAGGGGDREDWAKFKLKMRDEIGDILYSKTKRSPMILPVVNEI